MESSKFKPNFVNLNYSVWSFFTIQRSKNKNCPKKLVRSPRELCHSSLLVIKEIIELREGQNKQHKKKKHNDYEDREKYFFQKVEHPSKHFWFTSWITS